MKENAILPGKKRYPWWAMVVAVFVIVIVLSLFFPVIEGEGPLPKQAVARREMNGIEHAMKGHLIAYGVLPAGDGAAVMKILRGANAKKIVLFEGGGSKADT